MCCENSHVLSVLPVLTTLSVFWCESNTLFINFSSFARWPAIIKSLVSRAWTRFCWSWWQNTYWLNWDHDKGNPPFNDTGQKISGCFFTCQIQVPFLWAEISQQFTKRKSSSRPRVLNRWREEGQRQARHVKINIPVTRRRRWHSWWACGLGEPAYSAPQAAQLGSSVPICSTAPLLPGPRWSPALWMQRIKKGNRCLWSDVNSAHSHGNSLAVASLLRDDEETWTDVVHLL